MFKNFKPLHDRVLVERIKGEEKTAGGLYIPDAAQEKGQTGKVLAVGTGRMDHNGTVHALQVNVGDTVYFGKYSGTEVDETQVILREDEILGVINQ
jgi:chaperonin GroES